MLHKALSTCASYFLAVILFHIPRIFVYIHPASSSSMDQDQIIAVMYRVVTPMLNPLIYTLRNKEVKGALRRVMWRRLFLEDIWRTLQRHKQIGKEKLEIVSLYCFSNCLLFVKQSAHVLSCFSCVWLFATLGLYLIGLLCPWDSPGKNTGVGSHFLLHGVFLTQGLNSRLLCLLH